MTSRGQRGCIPYCSLKMLPRPEKMRSCGPRQAKCKMRLSRAWQDTYFRPQDGSLRELRSVEQLKSEHWKGARSDAQKYEVLFFPYVPAEVEKCMRGHGRTGIQCHSTPQFPEAFYSDFATRQVAVQLSARGNAGGFLGSADISCPWVSFLHASWSPIAIS